MKPLARAILASSLIGPAAASATSFDVTVSSDKAKAPADIVISVHLPGDANASSTSKFPVVLQSHGWGGTRTSDAASFQAFLDAGFAVVSIDQRGHGASGGQANIEDPDYEGYDVIAVIDYVASQPWSLRNGDIELLPNGKIRKDQGQSPEDQALDTDPVLFSIGGSYGGAYQWAGMLTEMRDTGATRFDAIAPQITWNSLPESLAPNGVARSVYLSGLYGLKVTQGPEKIPDYIHTTYGYVMTTGNLPDGTVPGTVDAHAELLRHSPAGYGLNGQVNVPVLTRQGSTDVLFNMNQGYYNYNEMLTPEAQSRSLFIGYNGGHTALNPTGMIPQSNPGGDPCSSQIMAGGDFTDMTIAFFQSVMGGENPREILQADQTFYVASDTNSCIATDSLAANTTFPVATIDIPGVGGGTGALAGVAGIPVVTPIPGTGGIRIAGIPKLKGEAYAGAAEARVFFGIAKGPLFDPSSNPNTLPTLVVQNQIMPLRFALPATGENVEIDLGGIAVELTAEEQLYLVAFSIHDQYIAHASKTPGAIVLTNPQIELPVQP